MGRRIGSESQVMLFGCVAQMIENHAWLNARVLPLGIDLENLVEVLSKVEDDGSVAALTGKRCATTTGQNWRSVLATGGDSRDDIVDPKRDDDANWDLAVAGTVGCVHRAAARIESNFSGNVSA